MLPYIMHTVDQSIKPPYHDNRPSKVQNPVLQSQPEPQVKVEVVSFLLGHIFFQTNRSAVNSFGGNVIKHQWNNPECNTHVLTRTTAPNLGMETFPALYFTRFNTVTQDFANANNIVI